MKNKGLHNQNCTCSICKDKKTLDEMVKLINQDTVCIDCETDYLASKYEMNDFNDIKLTKGETKKWENSKLQKLFSWLCG